MKKTVFAGLLAATAFVSPASAATIVNPIHMWTFNDGTAKDSVGNLDGTLHGNAKIENGKLVLDGDKGRGGTFMSTGEMGGTFTAHTLVAWVSLDTLSQGGGAALSVVDNPGQGSTNEKFNAIVYGERTPNQWMAGSDFFRRTPVNNGGARETSLDEHMIAVTYAANGAITIYRDGQFYASGGTYSALTFANPIVLLGLRHPSVAGTNGLLKGSINQAAIYDTSFTADEIGSLYAQGAVVGGAGAVPEPATWALFILGFGAVGGALRSRRRMSVSYS
ncbi:PEPxxWA-CTERM sorting domain-containing protein [Qipengyuania sp.]|uniref:PEPxxWA-CTERM sorting domain-containing protein n=1 Tax=Qipengyuania sp. TaxID=2004515 RepID=UPI0035C8148D